MFSPNRLPDFNDRKPEAFTRMYLQYYPIVLSHVRRLAVVTQSPEDLTQEVFRKIWCRKRSDFQRLDQLEIYIYRVTETTFKNDLRDETNRQQKMPEIGRIYVDYLIQEDEKEQKRLAFDYLRYMAIEILAPQPRQVFLLHYVEGLKIRDIANQLNLSASTVANHINRGHHNLKMEVEKRGGRGEIYPALLLWILQAEFLLQNIFYENI